MARTPGQPSGKVVMEVREIGDREYTLTPPLAQLRAGGWVATRVPRKLNELQFPLYAFSPGDKAVMVGHAKISGVATTKYEVKLPGGSFHSIHVAPYSLYLWLDRRGRIRRASQTEVETRVEGHKGPLVFTDSVEFADFGVPVRVQAPRHYTLSPHRPGTT